MEEESLEIRSFEHIPTPYEFTTQIESKNIPAVFKGCVKDWKAYTDWNPSNDGLDYLQGHVGPSVVEAMLSKSAPVFYGDIRNHERIPLPFSTFIGYCKELYQKRENSCDVCFKQHGVSGSEFEQSQLASVADSEQVYLAQVPIMDAENEERTQLASLRQDIELPSFLEEKSLASINMWMNSAPARSSTHYDPHHNMLCIITGRKQVVLWPPSASPGLYPMPLYGEASNHSAVALGKVDLSVHPRAQYSMECSRKVTLHEGDALFIPEGWFHQVDSDCLTIAVNFWWRSELMSRMSEHMDAYYLRRILKRLTDKEMDQVLCKSSNGVGKMITDTLGKLEDRKAADQDVRNPAENFLSTGLKEKKLKERIMLNELEPFAIQSLHELISLVHNHVNIADQRQLMNSTSTSDLAVGGEGDCKQIVKMDAYHLEDDPVATILWKLHPLTLRSVFLSMAQNFPRTLEALVLHLLSPVGAEALTRKFDEMDQLIVEEERNEFYQTFYGVFDDQFAAMDVLLNRKESYALQAFKNVLDKYLGIKFDGSKPWVG